MLYFLGRERDNPASGEPAPGEPAQTKVGRVETTKTWWSCTTRNFQV